MVGHACGFMQQFRSIGDEQLRLGIGEDVRDFAILVEHVYGDEDDAGLDAGEVEIDESDAVRELNAEAVAAFEAALQKRVGHAIRSRVDLAESKCFTLEFKRDLIAPA